MDKRNLKKTLTTITLLSLFVFPASTNYQFNEFYIGPGGGDDLQSTNYKANEVIGDNADNLQQSNNYGLGAGLEFVQQANVPPAPTFVNDGNYYNKLKIIINEGGNPSDTEYAVAISSDDWATTQYVQSDFTVGSSLGSEDWQTYVDWGGSAGEFVIGLDSATTYKVKVKSRQGAFTSWQWGPEASATTSSLSLFFDIDVSAIDEETAPPYSIDFGDLAVGVNTASKKIWTDLETNGSGGGFVYIYADSDGLQSASHGTSIPSVSADLTTVNKGYGVQVASVTQTSGGPLIAQSPYDGSADNVGIVDTTIRSILSSSNMPITGGRGSISLKAKIDALTPAASDYSVTFTVIASATF